MQVAFSTSTVHARDRLDYWREEAARAYVAHDFDTPLGRSFQGVIRAGSLGALGLSLFECDECLVQRTHRCLRSAADDDLLIGRQTAGRMSLHQDGRDGETGVHDIFLLDPRRPFSLSVGPRSRSLVVKVPRWELQARLGDVSALTAMPLSGSGPVTALASGFLGLLASRVDAVDAVAGDKLAQQALDLVALAFDAEGAGGRTTLSSVRATTLLRLKAIIEAKVHDPDLKPVLAAAATGISVRYANALLAQEGTSLERFIMLRRLHHCRRALTDPAQALRTVSDIAFACGFSDVSHFARRFRAQYGCSPSECRPGARERSAETLLRS